VTVDEATCRALFASSPVARLATIGANGPHLVPLVFAIDGQRIISAVDHKPKRTRDLVRLRNITVDPRVSLLVDHYREDWSELWWVRADGRARIIDTTDDPAAIDFLVASHPQYRDARPAGPLIEIVVGRWVGWTASGAHQ